LVIDAKPGHTIKIHYDAPAGMAGAIKIILEALWG